MRVSVAHGVAQEWPFERINLDPEKSKSKHVDTQKQFADILTKGRFTRDEWSHLLCLFNIVRVKCFLVATSAKFTTSKRRRCRKENEEKMSGWLQNLDLRNQVSVIVNRSSTVSSSTSSQSPMNLAANRSTLDSLETGKLAAMDSNQNMWHTNIDPNSSTARPVARSRKITIGLSLFPENFALLPGDAEYVAKVFTSVPQKLGCPKEHKMEYVNSNAMIWGLFLSVSMKVDVHLGKDFEENLRVTKTILRYDFCSTAEIIIDEEEENFGVSTIDCDQTPWMRS